MGDRIIMPAGQQLLSTLFSHDWVLFFIIIALILIGIVAIQSATVDSGSQMKETNFQKQIIWAILGLLIYFSISLINFRFLYALAYFALLAGILLVLLTYIPAISKGASGRWIGFGGLTIQPSEFMKVFLIIGLARLLTDNIKNLSKPKSLILPFIIAGVVTLLVLRQPDLGTAMVFPAILFPMLFWSAVPVMTLFLIIAPIISLLSAFNLISFVFWIGLILLLLWFARKSLRFIVLMFLLNVSVGLVTPMMWNNIRPYQQKRILTYVNKQLDPRGSGYQVLQSKVAIGSGGMYGKGLGDGTQSQLKFLPEQHTDFIISLIGEELGFIGVSTVLLLFFFLLAKIINKASNSKNVFESLVLIGISALLLFQIFINIGMTTGLVPVTGLPLPFISYGGSSLLAMMILMGLVQSVSRNI
ncbi:MAG: rod shape-determining protein RodA [Candidatus Marinimicrobia bacterium]|nr:rod shape-determining protein RodA [Candidatus Neomarinimicrobiota bacterium]